MNKDDLGKNISFIKKVKTVDSLPFVMNSSVKANAFRSNDTLWYYQRLCKSIKIIKGQKIDTSNLLLSRANTKDDVPFLRIHGNIQYNYLYQSYIDTPFSQHNFQQHTIQTSLSITVKDQYPFKVSFSNRRNNSPYFSNFFGTNLQFDSYSFNKNKKQQLVESVIANSFQRPDLKMLEAQLKGLTEKLNFLKNRLHQPDILQAIVEERERSSLKIADRSPVNTVPAIGLAEINRRLTFKKESPFAFKDSIKKPNNAYSTFIEEKQTELDSLQQAIFKLRQKSDSIKNVINKDISLVRQKVYKSSSYKELRKIAAENGVENKEAKGIDDVLSNIKSIGIGRSLINYSELTVWNVSLTGFNAEYNPGIYTAMAFGKVDYGFRDFFGKKASQNSQNIIIGRIGLGDKDQRAVILSAFTGKKYNYASAVSDTARQSVNIAGYSVEAILKKDENTNVEAEVAKTTKPLIGQTPNGLHSLVNLGDKTNLGISIKGKTFFRKTDTRLSGTYKRTGENFQSFSLFTYNTDQTSWLLKADQSMLKSRVGLIVMLRRNDFTNPFTEKTFKTSTVFKTFQLNLRFPKLPAVSAGYYPGTQLYILDKERIRENAYYILNGSVVYNYSIGAQQMLSSFVVNNYSNKATDSGFISYNGVNYVASHSLIFPKLRLLGSYTFTDQEQMKYTTWEAAADLSLAKFLKIGGAAKFNKVRDGGGYWGRHAMLSLQVGNLGGLQLQYEKSYLPTITKTLYPMETGNISWFKYF